MSASNWPPELKNFVNDTFAKCTDANRKAVEAELKAVIYQKFEANQLHTTKWADVKLESMNPKKRKAALYPPTFVNNKSKADEEDRRDKRAKRFEAGGAGSEAGLAGRMGEYANSRPTTPYQEPSDPDPNVIDWDKETIVGTSQKLEKPYLRLTSRPDERTIRPLPILKQTLDLLKKKWKQDSNYNYICDQFKSMRQDLIVQRITNDFTVQVYEIHARIALEKGDLGEFNQCQSRLRHLYRLGLQGHPMEFLGYRILYLLFSRNRSELNSTLAELTPDETRDASVSHALAVRLAVSQGNYTKFFRLFNAAPKMGAYVMDHFVKRERVTSLVAMCKAYIQVPLSLLISQLAFDTDQEALEFLEAYKAAIFKTPSTRPDSTKGLTEQLLDCKKAGVALGQALTDLQKADLKGQI